MNETFWDMAVPMAAFCGTNVATVGLLGALVTFDELMGLVSFGGLTMCGSVWAWHLVGPVSSARG